jgi:hypothetical protein
MERPSPGLQSREVPHWQGRLTYAEQMELERSANRVFNAGMVVGAVAGVVVGGVLVSIFKK